MERRRLKLGIGRCSFLGTKFELNTTMCYDVGSSIVVCIVKS